MGALLIVVAGVLVLLGSLLPWATVEVDGAELSVALEHAGGGWRFLALLLGIATLLLGLVRHTGGNRHATSLAIVTSAGALAIGFVVAWRALNQPGVELVAALGVVDASFGAGVWALGAGAVAALVARWV